MIEFHEIPTYAADREPHKQSARGVILHVRVNSVERGGQEDIQRWNSQKSRIVKVVGFFQISYYCRSRVLISSYS